jgi:hypothetical protein
MDIVNVPLTPIAFVNSTQEEFWNEVASGAAEAAVSFGTPCPSCLAWDGAPYLTFVGQQFDNQNFMQQEALLGHEMGHVYTGYSSTYGGGFMESASSPYYPDNLSRVFFPQQ